MSQSSRIIAIDELAKHSDSKDCWIAIHGRVLDITPFLNEHPGGPDVVVSVSGRDCTHEFEDVGHTDSARRLGDKYIIGSLEGHDLVEAARLPTNKEVQESRERSSQGSSMNLFMLGTAALAGLAALYHTLSSQK